MARTNERDRVPRQKPYTVTRIPSQQGLQVTTADKLGALIRDLVKQKRYRAAIEAQRTLREHLKGNPSANKRAHYNS